MEYDKVRRKLISIYKRNKKEMKEYDERKKSLNISSINYRFISTVLCSMPIYVVSLFLTAAGVLGAYLPVGLIPFTCVAASLALGDVLARVIEKVSGDDKKIKTITTNKSQKEIIKEKTNCIIEKNRYKNRNEIIKGIVHNIDEEKKTIENLSSKYDISMKKIDKSEEDCSLELSELDKSIDNKYHELDILSKKQVLQREFFKYRETGSYKIEAISTMAAAFFCPFICSTLPIALSESLTAFCSSIDGVMALLMPGIVGVAAASTIGANYHKNNFEVFTELNNELGSNKLETISDVNIVDDSLEIAKQLEKSREEIISLECEFFDKKNCYNTNKDNNSNLNNNVKKNELGTTIIDLSYLDENNITKENKPKTKVKSKTNK